MDQNIEKMNGLRSRLQFTIMIVLFFPTFVGYLTTGAIKPPSYADPAIAWGLVIGIYIIIYILAERIKENKTPIMLENFYVWIDRLLFIEILSFLPLFFVSFFSNIHNQIFVKLYTYLIAGSMLTAAAIPVVILFMLVLNMIKANESNREIKKMESD